MEEYLLAMPESLLLDAFVSQQMTDVVPGTKGGYRRRLVERWKESESWEIEDETRVKTMSPAVSVD